VGEEGLERVRKDVGPHRAKVYAGNPFYRRLTQGLAADTGVLFGDIAAHRIQGQPVRVLKTEFDPDKLRCSSDPLRAPAPFTTKTTLRFATDSTSSLPKASRTSPSGGWEARIRAIGTSSAPGRRESRGPAGRWLYVNTHAGAPEVQAVNNVAFMRRYFNDWRFVLGRVGSEVAFLHIEPDFWGFAQQVNEDPDAIPAAVATANPTDCGGEENSIAGLGRCMIAMVRKYAPNALVGLHGSGWATRFDVLLNRDSGFDVPFHGRRLGAFLAESGAGLGDYVVVDAADRDAGYYQSIGQNRWWDATNASLPNFQQAFAWGKALAERVGRPIVWWQLPLGHMALPNTANRWKDNRVDYFLTHVDEVAAAHGAGMAFGAGAGDQTTPETDDGNFVSRVLSYLQGGSGGACP
jgi:hypothetical protein